MGTTALGRIAVASAVTAALLLAGAAPGAGRRRRRAHPGPDHADPRAGHVRLHEAHPGHPRARRPGDHADQGGRVHPRVDGLAAGPRGQGEGGRADRGGRPHPGADRQASRAARPARRREEAGHRSSATRTAPRERAAVRGGGGRGAVGRRRGRSPRVATGTGRGCRSATAARDWRSRTTPWSSSAARCTTGRGRRPVGAGGVPLALVHGLVTRMGGTIRAGPAPEGGACFTVAFPSMTTA